MTPELKERLVDILRYNGINMDNTDLKARILHCMKDAYTLDRNEWQLCPKCNGSGQYYYQQMGSQTTAAKFGFHQCDLCIGTMVIAKPTSTDIIKQLKR